MKPIYYKYYFEDEPTDSKYRIKIKNEEMLMRDNTIQFLEMDKATIDSRTIDHFFLDAMTHYSLIEIDDYLEYHFSYFSNNKEEFLLHTERILKKAISLMEFEAKEWKKKDPNKNIMRPCDNPEKYLTYHRDALNWINEKKRSGYLNSSKYQNDILNINKILRKYPKSLGCYLSAIDKLENDKFERNLLDDLRLTLEIFIKGILNNSKSLENQREYLGRYCKEKGVSKEVSNMFDKLIDLYSKYQNNYVKHDDKVNKNEISLIFNLTNAFIDFLK